MACLSLRCQTFSLSAPALLVHGGAWDIPDDVLQAHRDGLRAAVDEGRRRLQAGEVAIDVVTAVVASLEDHGAFDAGRGAMLNQDGRAELDAGVMDGATLSYGSVMATQRLRNPVRVARRLMDAGAGKVRMLAGEGAERFAASVGIDLVDNDLLVSSREKERFQALKAQAEAFHPSQSFVPGRVGDTLGSDGDTLDETHAGHDTVGCVALDASGHLAAATSTGGTPYKPPGRVGDSPLPGAGFYATSDAAASATGWGEAITAVVLASRAVDAVGRGDASGDVVEERLTHMHGAVADPDGRGAAGGLLLLGADGSAAIGHTTPRMARAVWGEGRDAAVFV